MQGLDAIHPARVLVVGGLDPCGGAGITADARMAHALDVFPLTVATCLTVQNRHGVTAVEPVGLDLLLACLDAAFADGPLHAVKIGLCPSPDALDAILSRCDGLPCVVDPVLSATSGGLSSREDLVAGYLAACPRITLLTPNLAELARLAPGGASDLLDAGCRHVLVKGGHAEPLSRVIEDRLVSATGELILRHPRLDLGPVHGTGCALATAVAARLAMGADMETACGGAVRDVEFSLMATAKSTDGLPVPLRIRGSLIERGPSERGPSERGPSERGPSERDPSERDPSERDLSE